MVNIAGEFEGRTPAGRRLCGLRKPECGWLMLCNVQQVQEICEQRSLEETIHKSTEAITAREVHSRWSRTPTTSRQLGLPHTQRFDTNLIVTTSCDVCG